MSASLRPPPSDVPPGPHGNEYMGTLMSAFIWCIAGIDTVVVVARVATKYWLSEFGLWWDDYFIILALTATLIGSALDGVEHEYYLSKHELQYFTAYTYGEWIQTFLTLMAQKVSICFFLMRLPVTKAHIRPLQGAVEALLLSNLALTLTWILQCIPVQAVWDSNTTGKCLSENQLLDVILAQAIISIVSDFGLSLYPILIIRCLKMTFRQKFGLAVLMGLGLITGSCAIVRTVLYKQSLATDATYGGITNWFWRLFEVNLGIVCACIPPLLKGYKWLLRRLNGFTGLSGRPSGSKSAELMIGDGHQGPIKLDTVPSKKERARFKEDIELMTSHQSEESSSHSAISKPTAAFKWPQDNPRLESGLDEIFGEGQGGFNRSKDSDWYLEQPAMIKERGASISSGTPLVTTKN